MSNTDGIFFIFLNRLSKSDACLFCLYRKVGFKRNPKNSMKKLLYSALATVLFATVLSSCSDEGVAPKKDSTSDNISARVSGATPGAYTYTATSSDGKTWTIIIDQSAAQDISHINFAGS